MVTGFAFLSRLTQIAQPHTRFVFLGAGIRLGLPSHPASQRRSCLRLGVSTTSSSRGLSPPIDRPCRAYSRTPAAPLASAPLDPGTGPTAIWQLSGHMGPDRHAPKAQDKPTQIGRTRLRECKGLTGPLHMRSGTCTGLRRRHCPGNASTTQEKAHKTPAAFTAKTPRFGLQITAATRAGTRAFVRRRQGLRRPRLHH